MKKTNFVRFCVVFFVVLSSPVAAANWRECVRALHPTNLKIRYNYRKWKQAGLREMAKFYRQVEASRHQKKFLF